MRLTISQARSLAAAAMEAAGFDAGDAALVADHLIDCELRGIKYGGLARAVSIAERVARTGTSRAPIRVVRETSVSATLDGGDRIGYVVAHHAMTIAMTKASSSGIAVVAAGNTWYTGMLSYYAEMAAAQGLVSVIASNATAWVAPYGATEGRLGTNPICVAFPSADDPVIWDIGTSAIMHAEVALAARVGEPLPPSAAYDDAGQPTRDPAAALRGAFAAWGGHKGSGLGIVVQLLGTLAGGAAMPPELAGFGIVIITLQPGLLTDADEFRRTVSSYARSVRAARPVPDGPPVRMPFDRSRAERRRRVAEDAIEVDDRVYRQVTGIARRL